MGIRMIDKLIQKIERTGAPIVVGLDPMLKYIPEHLQKKAFAVARNLKGMGMPFDQIVQATGLTLADVEAL